MTGQQEQEVVGEAKWLYCQRRDQFPCDRGRCRRWRVLERRRADAASVRRTGPGYVDQAAESCRMGRWSHQRDLVK